MTKYDFILALLERACSVLITLAGFSIAFVLFRNHLEGGAYFLGLLSPSPAALAGYAGKGIGIKTDSAPPQTLATTTSSTDTTQSVTQTHTEGTIPASGKGIESEN